MTPKTRSATVPSLALLLGIGVIVGCTREPESPPTPAPETPTASTYEYLTAVVTRVVNGDTLKVVFQDGTKDTIRLLGVDAPETSGNNPGEYDEITDTACLDKWGILASEYARSVLDGQTVTVVIHVGGGNRGTFDRLLAYVQLDGQDFGASLGRERLRSGVHRGHCQPRGRIPGATAGSGGARARLVGVQD